MTVIRVIAAAAMFAGLAVGTASTAWAAPTMSGHYIATDTVSSGGQSITSDWYFTPCGDGCANVSIGTTGTSQARLVNNQWTLDTDHTTVCPDGSKVSRAGTAHYTWDPNTLAGTDQITEKIATCGATTPESWTNNLQLRRAGEGSSPNKAPEK
jgi:hypothetical protein